MGYVYKKIKNKKILWGNQGHLFFFLERKCKKSTPTVFLKCKIFLFLFLFLSCYSCFLGVESMVASLDNFNKIKYSFS